MVPSNGVISAVIGINPGLSPNGIVTNKGFEVRIGWSDHIGDIAYSLKTQMSVANNKIINRDEQFYEYPYLKTEGHEIGQIFGLVNDGFFNNQSEIENSIPQNFSNVRPGDVKYVDQNGDGFINKDDRVPMGYANFPERYYSGILSIGYKGFLLTVNVQGAGKRSIMLTQPNIYWPLVEGDNMSTWYKNYWRPGKKVGVDLPRLTTKNNNNNFRNSNIWLREGNFVKIRFASLSYTFPTKLISKAHIRKAIIFISGRNLYTFSKFKYADPENVNTDYPTIREFNIGFKIKI
jgi:hypothetical protein